MLEQYEIHRATPESPRSQKMCIALVLRTVVSNKYGELLIRTSCPSCLFFFQLPSGLGPLLFNFFRWRDFGTSTLTHGSIAPTASLFPKRKWLLLKLQALDAKPWDERQPTNPFWRRRSTMVALSEANQVFAHHGPLSGLPIAKQRGGSRVADGLLFRVPWATGMKLVRQLNADFSALYH